MIKRNNHYIWAHYLRGWSKNNVDIYRRTRKGVSSYPVQGLACEMDFYKISTLNDADVEFIQRWIFKADADLQEFHNAFLEKMIEHSCRISVLTEEKDIRKRELLLSNTIENIHEKIENDVKPILDALRNGKLSILNSIENRHNFHSYIGHQFTRTKFFRDTFAQAMKLSGDSAFDLTNKNWWFLSIIFGVNVGCSIDRFYYRKNVVWLVNKTDTPFLTSDNPVINVHPDVLDCEPNGVPPENTDFYFPISPTMAYMINDSDMYGVGVMEVDVSFAELLNRNILLRSDQTVFGDTADIIKKTKVPKPQKTQ
jgi:hypothetical protein